MSELEFNELINTHSQILKSHALKFTNDLENADDLVQDTMVKAIRFKDKFQEGSNIKAWLFVIMRNTFVNEYRKSAKTRLVVTTEEEISSPKLMYSAQSNGSTGKLIMDDIQKALEQLADTYRIPFVRYFEGYKYHEIAEELNLPLGTVKTHIHEARLRLKRYLKTYADLEKSN